MQENVIDPNLAAIKQRVQNVRDAIRRGEPMIDLEAMGGVQFTQQQIGLCGVVADEQGRIWRYQGDRMILTFSPSWLHLGDDQPRQPVRWDGTPTTLDEMDAEMGYDRRRYDGK